MGSRDKKIPSRVGGLMLLSPNSDCGTILESLKNFGISIILDVLEGPGNKEFPTFSDPQVFLIHIVE